MHEYMWLDLCFCLTSFIGFYPNFSSFFFLLFPFHVKIQTIFLICKLLLAARDQSQWGRIHWYKLPSEIPQIYTNTNVKVKSNLNGAAKIHHSNQYDQYIPEHTPICVVSLICKVDGDKSVGAGVGGALSGTATDDVYQSLR